MESHNPYQTPQAEVESATQEFQTPKIFAINGRIGRLRYFAYSVLYSCVAMFFVMTAIALMGDQLDDETSLGVLTMLSFIPVYAVVMKRRLNDLGRTGWFCLIGFIPIVGGILGFYLLLAKGETHANEYGLPPEKDGKGPLVFVVIIAAAFVIGIAAAILAPMYEQQANRANVSEVSN